MGKDHRLTIVAAAASALALVVMLDRGAALVSGLLETSRETRQEEAEKIRRERLSSQKAANHGLASSEETELELLEKREAERRIKKLGDKENPLSP